MKVVTPHKKERRKPIGLPLADLLYLRRRQMGLAQEKLAMRLHKIAESSGSWSGATPQLIHRYEMGTIPRSDSLEWLAEALDLSIEAIREQARQQNALLEGTNSPKINDRSAFKAVVNFGAGDREVKRRELASVGLGALGIIPGLDLERLQAVLSGKSIDEQSLEQLRAVTDSLMQKSWNAEPASLLPTVRDHFNSFGNLLLRVPSKFSTQILSMAGEVAFLAGDLNLKAGFASEVDSYWQTSEWMAKSAGDTGLHATLITGYGWRFYDQGQLDQALKIFDQAQSVLGKNLNPAVAALVYSSRSYWLTAIGQEQAAVREINIAEHYLQQLPRDDAPIYTLETVRENVEGARGWHLLHIGHYTEAASTFEQMLDRINPTWKMWQATAKADLASVYAQQGNIEQAAHTFSSALHTALEAGAVRWAQRTFRLRQQWLCNNDSPAVHYLDEEFASSLIPDTGYPL